MAEVFKIQLSCEVYPKRRFSNQENYTNNDWKSIIKDDLLWGFKTEFTTNENSFKSNISSQERILEDLLKIISFEQDIIFEHGPIDQRKTESREDGTKKYSKELTEKINTKANSSEKQKELPNDVIFRDFQLSYLLDSYYSGLRAKTARQKLPSFYLILEELKVNTDEDRWIRNACVHSVLTHEKQNKWLKQLFDEDDDNYAHFRLDDTDPKILKKLEEKTEEIRKKAKQRIKQKIKKN